MTASRSATGRVSVVRVYGDPGRAAGEYRVLVDRLWPRGMARSSLDSDLWLKDVAPSTGLRRWYAHDPALFEEFARKYRDELRGPPGDAALSQLREAAAHRSLVLLTATKDVEHSGAQVLRDVLAGPAS